MKRSTASAKTVPKQLPFLPKLWQRSICFEHAHKDSHVTTKIVESAAQIILASCTSSESTIIETKEWIALESMVSRCDQWIYS